MISIKQRIKETYMFLFIFTSVNRVFTPVGLDLRYILVIIGVYIIISDLYNKNFELCFSFTNLITLYLFMGFSSIYAIFYNQNLDLTELLNINILIVSILISLIVLSTNREFYSEVDIYNYLEIAMVFLLISMTFVIVFKDMSLIYGHNYSGWVPHKNLLGFSMRVAGYAEDANQATFWLITYLVLTVFRKQEFKYKLIRVLIIVVFSLISASKTVHLGLITAVVFMLIKKYLLKLNRIDYIKVLRLTITVISPLIIVFAVVIFDKYLPFNNMDTMSNRYLMWREAINMFTKKPIFGWGLTSFRNQFDQLGFWFVQSHSTIFQLMSELGSVGLIMYLYLVNKWLKNSNDIISMLTIIIFVFSFTTELLYLPFFAVYRYIENDNIIRNQKFDITKDCKTKLFLNYEGGKNGVFNNNTGI